MPLPSLFVAVVLVLILFLLFSFAPHCTVYEQQQQQQRQQHLQQQQHHQQQELDTQYTRARFSAMLPYAQSLLRGQDTLDNKDGDADGSVEIDFSDISWDQPPRQQAKPVLL
ncbi:hypothetical protein GQ42DRAFT_155063 [Ramicandelaber brevisporus]|nr:hypothetical protein GQ42DRAFT_155063 [Ramicandelaber brevisporus]